MMCAPNDPIPFGTWYLVWARCCRWWQVAMGYRIGRCGYCGEVPLVTDETPSAVELRRSKRLRGAWSPEALHRAQWRREAQMRQALGGAS